MSNRCVVKYEWTASWAVSSCPFALQEVTITSVIIKKASILCNHGSNDPPSQNRFTFRAFWSFLWSLACFDCPVRLKMKCNATSNHVQPKWLDVTDHFYTFYVYLKRLEKTLFNNVTSALFRGLAQIGANGSCGKTYNTHVLKMDQSLFWKCFYTVCIEFRSGEGRNPACQVSLG